MESVSLPLPLLYLLLIILVTCVCYTLATYYNQSENEKEFLESYEAQTARREKRHQEQMRAAHAERDWEKRANGSLRHKNSTLVNVHAAAVTTRGREQRESERQRHEIQRQRREIDDLKEKLGDATYARSTVENASYVKEQWNSISGTLAKAGFVAKTPEDLAWSIEKLLELQNSAEALPDQAELDKKELANEKAAKEAALFEVTDLKTKTRILEINIKDLEAAAEEHPSNQQSSPMSSAEIQATVQLEVDQRMAKEREEMIRVLQDQYNKEQEQLIKELQGQFYQEVATEVNSQLNDPRRRNGLDDEAAARAATEIESFKDHATKLQEQFKQAHETATVAEGKLRDANNTVLQKDREYTAMCESAQTTITEKDDQIKALGEQITHMQNTATTQAMTSAESKTTSDNLERELAQARSRISQVETALSAANKETERMRADGQKMLAEGQKLQTQHDKLANDLEAAGKELQTQREQFGGNLATGGQLQQLQMQIQNLESDLDTAGRTANMHKEGAQNLKSQLRKANDEIERIKVKTKKDNDDLRAYVDVLRKQVSQGPHSNMAAGQQGGASTSFNIPAPKPQYSEELKELGLAFEGQVTGVDPVELTKIVTDNCAQYRNAGSDAEIDFGKLPVYVKHLLFAYMHKNKVDGETESDDDVKIRVEDRVIKTPKPRTNQHGRFQTQQQHGTPAPPSSLAFGTQAPDSQHGAFQPQQNGTPAPTSSFDFGASRNSGPAPASSSNFTASQNIIPGPSNSFALPANSFQAPSSNPFGAPTSSSQPSANAQNL